jgi:hypothetical protein
VGAAANQFYRSQSDFEAIFETITRSSILWFGKEAQRFYTKIRKIGEN